MTLYYRPLVEEQGSHVLAGGWCRFSKVEVLSRHGSAELISADEAPQDILHRLTSVRSDLGASTSTSTGTKARPQVMGILNTTPDSFSDGGQFDSRASARAHAARLMQEGADIIDIGGESTRPGAELVSRNQELARILPPITALVRADLLISVDTRHAAVMTRATAAGAAIINDVEALQGEDAMKAAAASGAPVVMMHMKGTPGTMQQGPVYDFAPVEIYEFLKQRVAAAIAAGIPASSIAIDPGFGFGKTLTHNLQLVNWLSRF